MGVAGEDGEVIGWQVKAIAAAVLLAALGGLLWHDHHVTKRLNNTLRELKQADADYTALQTAIEHERKLQKDATDDYERRLAGIQERRDAIPTRAVRLCRPANAAVPTAGSAALGAAEGTAGEQPGTAGSDVEAGPDIGAALYAQADDNDQRAAQCNALIKWVRSR